MKSIITLLTCVLLSGCAYTQITIKAPESQPGPKVSEIHVETSSTFGYKGNAGSDGATAEAEGATLQPTVTR